MAFTKDFSTNELVDMLHVPMFSKHLSAMLIVRYDAKTGEVNSYKMLAFDSNTRTLFDPIEGNI